MLSRTDTGTVVLTDLLYLQTYSLAHYLTDGLFTDLNAFTYH